MTNLLKRHYTTPAMNYLDYANHVRGSLINDISEMERLIDEYIVRYFCRTKRQQDELREIIVSTKHLTYSGKLEILQHLMVKKRHLTTTKADILSKKLKYISRHRNVLAHCPLDDSLAAIKAFEPIKRIISFTKYEKGKVSVKFNKHEHLKLVEIIGAVNSYFFMKIYAKRKRKGR